MVMETTKKAKVVAVVTGVVVVAVAAVKGVALRAVRGNEVIFEGVLPFSARALLPARACARAFLFPFTVSNFCIQSRFSSSTSSSSSNSSYSCFSFHPYSSLLLFPILPPPFFFFLHTVKPRYNASIYNKIPLIEHLIFSRKRDFHNHLYVCNTKNFTIEYKFNQSLEMC